ncbi:NADAR family protein [Pseudonocardia sp. DSM 110487]|nr:NADAR family protein [Pseudonocardia sp. DSM 110487]QYN40853.1 NADAR family protein [Pseudonocardia sp. DSM 110487]
MIRTVDELVTYTAAGKPVEYLFFWGHRPHPSGRPGPSCLSQWWPAPFTVDGVLYRTAEHWMMAEKARLFGDERSAAAVLAAASPKEAKALGRSVRGFDGDRWDAAAFDIVVRGSTAKFGQDPQLRDYLVGTGDAVLVEASPLDAVWGIGLAADDPRARRPAEWPGRNLLGFALMQARHVLAPTEPAAAD